MRAPLSWSKHLPKTPSSKRLLLLFSCSTMSESLWSHELQYARLPCPSLSPKVCSNSCPLSQRYHPIISSSVAPFSSCPQRFPASESFPWVVSSHQVAKVLELQLQHQSYQRTPMTDLPIEWNGWISLQSKGLSRVFSNTTVQNHQFFGAQLSSQSNSHIHTWLLEKP